MGRGCSKGVRSLEVGGVGQRDQRGGSFLGFTIRGFIVQVWGSFIVRVFSSEFERAFGRQGWSGRFDRKFLSFLGRGCQWFLLLLLGFCGQQVFFSLVLFFLLYIYGCSFVFVVGVFFSLFYILWSGRGMVVVIFGRVGILLGFQLLFWGFRRKRLFWFFF